MDECPNDPNNGYGSHNTTHPLTCHVAGCDCLGALRKDAERYRWLRDNPLWSVSYRVKPRTGMKEWRMRNDGDYWGNWWPTHEQAVDHAMAAVG